MGEGGSRRLTDEESSSLISNTSSTANAVPLPPLGKAFVRCSSADSGFGLTPDGAWAATRYTCPGHERRKSGKELYQGVLDMLNNELIIVFCQIFAII